MNLNQGHRPTRGANAGASLFHKAFVTSIILTVLLAAFSVSGVLAAPSAARGRMSNADLEQSWRDKVKQLRAEMALFNRMQLLPGNIVGCSHVAQQALQNQGATPNGTDNNGTANDQTTFQGGTGRVNRNSCFYKWTQAQNRLERYKAIMRQAQALLVNGGFDANGQVTNANQARISVQNLGWYLSTLRNIRTGTEGIKVNSNFQSNNSNTTNTTP